MELKTFLGSCVLSFFIAVVFDVVGLILLFVGIFADLRVDGRFYGDFFVYTGALVVFLSLAFWLMWYAWNVQVTEDGGLKKRSSIALLARKLSERLSQKLKGEERVKCAEDCGSPARKASRVTWGKTTAHHNEGYDASLDSPAPEKEEEKEGKQEVWTASI